MSPFGRPDRSSERDPKSGSGEFSIAGRPVQCPHCGGRQFQAGEAQLNRALTSLLNLDWIDRSANVLICTTCSHIEWFGERPEMIS